MPGANRYVRPFQPAGNRRTIATIALENQMTANRTIVIALATIVAVGLGYWGYGTHKKRELNQTAVAALADASARMREALSIEAAPIADRAQAAQKLEEHVAAMDRHLKGLQGLDTSRNRALADTADHYLFSVREILKKQADSHRHRLLLADSLQALREHMRADNRTRAWVQQAVKAKERVNKDYRGYARAAEALGQFIETFPASQARIAPYVGASALIPDELTETARQSVLASARQAAAEVEKMDRMLLPR